LCTSIYPPLKVSSLQFEILGQSLLLWWEQRDAELGAPVLVPSLPGCHQGDA